ncbi:MAG: NAD-dependent epimerase/dehydratase family protein [Candidatus Dormibacteria bacterium]
MARIAVTGGTGFIGIRVTRALREAGHDLVLISRGERRSRRNPAVTQVRANVVSGEGLEAAFAGCDVVVHLVAIIREPRAQLTYRLVHRNDTQTFDSVNRGGAQHVADAAGAAGVDHLIDISAIGVGPDPAFPYLASKWGAEQAVRGSGVPFTIIRPSLVYGPGDGFFTVLTKLVRFNPVIPIAGDGRSLFQPIFVDDLARIITAAVERGPRNATYEVGGPEHLSYNDIIHAIRSEIGARYHAEAHVPVALIRPAAMAMSALLSRPPVTPGQLNLLKKNNVTRRHAVLNDWGFEPLSFRDNCAYLQDY